MIIVLDSNVLVASLGRKSPYRPIFDALIMEGFEIAASNEILSEYAEVIEQKTTSEISQNVLRLLMNLPNLKLIQTYYNWHLIVADPDDDKFFDCAIAAQADYIVSDDGHFKVLKDIPFPKMKVIKGTEFLELLENMKK